MPTYTFRDLNTGEEFDLLMSWDEREKHLKDNQHLEPVICAPMLGDSVRLGVRTVDNGFREVLSKIHNSQPKSNLADKLSRR
jgi:hypothetical protein